MFSIVVGIKVTLTLFPRFWLAPITSRDGFVALVKGWDPEDLPSNMLMSRLSNITQGRLTTTVAPKGTSTVIQLTGVPTESEALFARTGRPFTFKEETLPKNVACQCRGGPERFVNELS